MPSLHPTLGLLLGVALLFGCSPRTVYVGGPILTVDPEDRIVEALGVEGDTIGAVGSEADVRAWAGSSARVVDLGGRTLVPGFIDAHGHFPGEGVWATVADLNPPPIGDVRTMAQLLDRLRTEAAETPTDAWVMGMGYDDTLLAEGRHPTRHDLDEVSTEHPIGILHISGHLAVVNSRGLEVFGWNRDTPDMPGGVLQRDAGGELTGVLEENAVEPLQEAVTNPGIGDSLTIVREAGRRALSQGVTTAQSGHTPEGLLRLLPWASRLGLIPLRLVLWPGMEAADALLDGGAPYTTYDPDWVRIGAIKLIADGSIQGYTGYLAEPYHVPPGDDPSYRGYPRIAADELADRVQRYHEAGLQVAVHGNGDASIEDILAAFDGAFADGSGPAARPVIIHAQMAREDQLDRMAPHGVIPSFFSLHTYYWGDRHRDRFMGPERAARISPAASALAKGVRFTIHCDAPIVPMTPLKLIWAAVNRETSSGQPLGREQRITPMQALRATTIDAAFQHFEEDRKGSLEVGKLADLVILSGSLLDDPASIDELHVVETIVGGETVYRAEVSR